MRSATTDAPEDLSAGLPVGGAAAVPDRLDDGRKVFSRGTHRTMDPAATLANLKPLMPAVGITRVANLTGLDVTGVPVVAVCRPNSRSNIVAQGKGLDLDAAKISGMMEAIEGYYAERIMQPVIFASASEMGERYALADLDGLPRRRTTGFNTDTRILWTASRDVCSHREAWLPYEMVHANFSLPHPPGAGNFPCSTNGLAAGNSSIEALSHGICEAVERDAATLFDLTPRATERRRVDLSSIDDPDCLAVIDRIQVAGLAVAIWDITSDVGIAVFQCQIMERGSGPGLLALPAEGHGCHLDRSVALLRALTEAAQARVTAICGLREDIGPDMYGRYDDPDTLEAWRRVVTSTEAARRFTDVPTYMSGTVAGDIAHALGRLRSVGIDQVLSIELTAATGGPVSVTRVVIPGLEPVPRSSCAFGARARAVIMALHR
jgi:ribosomal protein S12 methylthiotransferase accessory factor